MSECGIIYYCLPPRLDLVNLGKIYYFREPIYCSTFFSYIDSPTTLEYINIGALKLR